jgi:hypothetical protein
MFDLANLATNGSFSLADERLLLETYFEKTVGDEVQRTFDAMKVASALREAAWAMVSATHLAAPGADYCAHAADYLVRTEVALAHYIERHGIGGAVEGVDGRCPALERQTPKRNNLPQLP